MDHVSASAEAQTAKVWTECLVSLASLLTLYSCPLDRVGHGASAPRLPSHRTRGPVLLTRLGAVVKGIPATYKVSMGLQCGLCEM